LIKKAEEEFLTGSLKSAFTSYKRIVEQLRAEGDQRELSYRLGRLSCIALLAGDVRTALAAAEEGERIAKQAGYKLGRGICSESLVMCFFD